VRWSGADDEDFEIDEFEGGPPPADEPPEQRDEQGEPA
jgi:hypothetical protein